jgi:hypothetical protein
MNTPVATNKKAQPRAELSLFGGGGGIRLGALIN